MDRFSSSTGAFSSSTFSVLGSFLTSFGSSPGNFVGTPSTSRDDAAMAEARIAAWSWVASPARRAATASRRSDESTPALCARPRTETREIVPG